MRKIVKGLTCAAVLLAAAQIPPAFAQDGPPYLFEHSCKTGITVSILTPDIKVQEALTKLFEGAMTPYEFLDFMRTNAKPNHASRDEAAALDMLSKCMEIHIQKI